MYWTDSRTQDDNHFRTSRILNKHLKKPCCPTISAMSGDMFLSDTIERSGPNLHHVKRIVGHLSHDPNARINQVHLCGTFTDLDAAKKATYSAPGYPKQSFSSFESKQDYSNVHEWPYDAAVYMRAKSENGEVFTVEVETGPNKARLTGDASGTVRGLLCHVLQQTNHYSEISEDLAGCKRETSIEGTLRTKLAARKCAEGVLLCKGTNRKDYVELSLYGEEEDSPYGSDVVAHSFLASPIKQAAIQALRLHQQSPQLFKPLD
jgi:hypothetical protein